MGDAWETMGSGREMVAEIGEKQVQAMAAIPANDFAKWPPYVILLVWWCRWYALAERG